VFRFWGCAVIFLYTDFGAEGPYLAQMQAVLAAESPGVPRFNLLSNAPAGDPRRAAYLLAALSAELPRGAIVLGVVDPGVGGERLPIVVEAGGQRFVGPDNGLFSRVAARDPAARAWRIDWRPERLSASFHGRDLFAPVAARLAVGIDVPMTKLSAAQLVGADWPDEIAEVVYADGYGNLFTGLRGDRLAGDAILEAGGRRLRCARTFSAVPAGEAFWYRNSCGLVEIAVNGGSARERLGLGVGAIVTLTQPSP
jgi:S-adenosyl-L-methionine hydrolase (adenosine-forming)